MLKENNDLHDKLVENVNYFRDKMIEAGFDIKPTQSAICAVMLYDAKLSQEFAAEMQKEGVFPDFVTFATFGNALFDFQSDIENIG